MPKYVVIFFSLICAGFSVRSQETKDSLILYDDFSTNAKFTDLTEKLIWSDSEVMMSGFQLNTAVDLSGISKKCLSLTPEAMEKTGYKPGTIKASQAIDYVLTEKLDRNQNTYKIEFDALWEELNNGSWGESGRIVVTLLHDYPEEIPFDAIYNLNAKAPFARPAYNLRIRNHNKTGAYFSGAFMLYGGGHDIEGEVEVYNNEYWLPGFSSEAGGTTPGLSDPFPHSPTMKNENFVTVGYPEWKHYTWLLKPERLEFYVRKSIENETANELVFFMQIPKSIKTETRIIEEINAAHQTSLSQLPVLYSWFRWIEAVRIYFRGSEQTHLANFKISKVLNSGITGNRYIANNDFIIYPNPCRVKLTIENRGGEQMNYSLYNSSGKIVKQGVIANGQTESRINVQQQPTGIYVLKATSKQRTKFQKIIINK